MPKGMPLSLMRCLARLMPGHGGFRHEKGAGDLRGGQAADGPQGQRDLRRWRQRRVAAHEQQDEGVVRI
jgi:hypothetical protein